MSDHPFQVHGQVAFVTGAAGGVGQGIVRVLAAAGARVVVFDKDEARAHAVTVFAAEHGARTVAIAGDVTSREDVRAAMARTVSLFGRLDILVNNAAIVNRVDGIDTNFVFVDNHAGNDPALEVAARAVQTRSGVSVGHFYPWRVMTAWGPELFGNDWKAVFGHGAEPNTSVMLYLMPDNVDMRHAVAGSLAPLGGRPMTGSRYVEIDGVQSQVYIDLRRVNESSITGGDPRLRPDPELGRIFVDRCAEALAKFVEWFRTVRAST